MSLHQAVRDGNLELVQSLIASGCDVNTQDSSKRTPLHLAVWVGRLDIVKTLILAKARVSEKAQDMFTALHFASQKPNSEEIIQLLVKSDKSLLNMKISKGNKTALHLAVIKGIKGNVEKLLELGADVTAKMNNGQTALDLTKDEVIINFLKSKLKSKESTHMTKNVMSVEEDDDSDANTSNIDIKKRHLSDVIPLTDTNFEGNDAAETKKQKSDDSEIS